jgi:hypothetical protein
VTCAKRPETTTPGDHNARAEEGRGTRRRNPAPVAARGSGEAISRCR